MTEVVDDIVENVSGFARGLIDKATELGIAAQGFDLKDGSYREAYNKIYNLYKKVSKARQELEILQKQGTDLKPEDVSVRIWGIRDGVANAQKALVGEHSGSLMNKLRSLEAQLSELLTRMHKSYVTYVQTDQESAFDLISAASAADAS